MERDGYVEGEKARRNSSVITGVAFSPMHRFCGGELRRRNQNTNRQSNTPSSPVINLPPCLHEQCLALFSGLLNASHNPVFHPNYHEQRDLSSAGWVLRKDVYGQNIQSRFLEVQDKGAERINSRTHIGSTPSMPPLRRECKSFQIVSSENIADLCVE
jgi:hypothetical protein